MTTISDPSVGDGAAAATPNGPVVVLGSTLLRVTPFNGLLLRAEHLEAMQSYGRELARQLGQAGGAGVALGLTVSLDDDVVTVEPGSGYTPAGEVLVLGTTQYVELDDLLASVGQPGAADAFGAWIVELVPAEVPAGDAEDVYRRLCDDPCVEAAGLSAYVGEGVALRLSDPGLTLDDYEPTWFRSALAASWFEQERRHGGALVATSAHADQATSLTSGSWATGNRAAEMKGRTEQSDHAVPLGVLARAAGGAWELDVWTARRNRIDTPPRRAWQWRMGMRPTNVFLAQVLQFQAQLAALVPLPPDQGDGRGGLWAGGVVELPSAGYLPVPGGEQGLAAVRDVAARVTPLFPEHFDLRFCTCRPDEVSVAVEAAQHLDRIPLAPSEARPAVDVLVPTDDDRPGYSPEWVVFHRRYLRTCPTGAPEHHEVKVLVVEVDDEAAFTAASDILRTGGEVDPTFTGRLGFEGADVDVASIPPEVTAAFTADTTSVFGRAPAADGVAALEARIDSLVTATSTTVTERVTNPVDGLSAAELYILAWRHDDDGSLVPAPARASRRSAGAARAAPSRTGGAKKEASTVREAVDPARRPRRERGLD